MKRLFYSGFLALMMLFVMPGIVRAQDAGEGGGETSTVTTLTSPTFSPGDNATIAPETDITCEISSDINLNDYNYVAFILFVEDNADVTLEATMQELYGMMQGSPSADKDFNVAIYADMGDDGDDYAWVKPITISKASGSVVVRARLAAINGDMEVEYSDVVTLNYTVEGEAVKPTAPTFSLEEGLVDFKAQLTLSNGYTKEKVALYPMYYIINGAETDFTAVTNMETIEESDLEEYNPDDGISKPDVISIDKNMTIRAATAKINSYTGNITWSQIVPKTYTIPTMPTVDKANGDYALNTEITVAKGDADSIFVATGKTVETATAFVKATADVTVTLTADTVIRAYAMKSGKQSDTVVRTYFVIPADEEGAPALTFTPANTDSVDNNTEILISGAPAGYSIEYGTYATVTAAKNAFYGKVYGAEGYPTVTEEEPVLKVSLIDRSTNAEFAYYRVYKVRAASDVPMPMIMSENAMAMEFGLYSKGEKVKIVAGDMDAIWYTTDGSKPAIDGATSTKIEGGAGEYTLNASTTIKAIAVKDGKASDVASAHFKLYEDATTIVSLSRGMSPLDSIAGKNSPITVAFACEESPSLTYMLPYTVYYTTDGTTEPDKDAYKEGGAIKKSESPIGEYGPEGYPSILISNEGATTVKAKVYMHVYMERELDEWIVSQTVSATIDSIVYGLADPEFTVQSGEVRMGDTIRIKNLNEFDKEKSLQASQTYFSVNGPLPSSDLASLDLSVVYSTDDEEVEDVVIIIEEDEKGTYAHIPSNEKYYDGSDTIYFEGELHIQAICYDMVAYGEGMMEMQGMLEYGSNFVEATYTVMKDFPKPVITPNGGIVSKGEEVEITAGEGLDIYYTIDGSEPEKGKAATKKYESPVVVNEALTLKAIAFKAGVDGARDSVSNVTEAVFYLVPEIDVKPVGNTEKDGKIIFADGNVAFDMFVKEFAERDTIFRLYVTIWNTANEEDFPLPDEFKAADSVRFVNTYYNGEYEATFALMQPDRRGGYTIAQDTTITFSVTENEEPVDVNPELSVKAVGVEEGENVVFNEKNVAFDMFVKNKVEGDSLVVSIYTKEQYDTMGQVEPTKFAVADSVRFTTTLEYGEYVGVFSVVRKSDKVGEVVVGEAVTIHFTVKEGQGGDDPSANEAGELAGVNVYPNPTAGVFNVAVPERARIDIFGLNGAKVTSREVNAGVEAFSLGHSGIYFIRVMAGNKTAVKRVVVR